MAKGGALNPVYIVTDEQLEINGGDFVLQQGPAKKVRGFSLDNYAGRKIKGGALQPVYVVPEASAPALHGGHWRVTAGQPQKVISMTEAERNIIQGPAIPVYPVDDDGNYDSDFAGAAFSPADIAGLIFWFQADSETGYSDGDPVIQFTDLSGNANHLGNVLATTYETNEINGKPIFRLDGVTGRAYKAVAYGAGYRAIFASCKKADVTEATAGLFSSVSLTPDRNEFVIASSGSRLLPFVNDNLNAGTNFLVNNTVYVLGLYTDGTNFITRINGVTDETNAYVHPVGLAEQLRAGYYIGGGTNGAWDVLEILYYHADVSAHISDIETYMAARAGVALP